MDPDPTTTGGVVSRNARLLAARRWIHDRQCTSGPECVSRDDHARRTQHEFARAAEAARDDVDELAALIHDHACHAHKMRDGGCADRAGHVATAVPAAGSLADAMRACG